MNKRKLLNAVLVAAFAASLLGGCSRGDSASGDSAAENISSADKTAETPHDKGYGRPKEQALIDAYPEFISDIRDNRIIFRDGSEMTFDDGKEKDFLQRLDDADPEDMFYDIYTLPDGAPEYLHDSGRSRSEELYKKMYGSSAAEVQKNLVNVEWAGETVRFTKVNGAADSLRAVAREVAAYPELKPYLKSSGTFYWRPVRGAKRLSAHSYGIAFDVAVAKSDYWQWNAKTTDEMAKVKYANKIPAELVEIFQRHGFIWGGAWYHYDTMHFEFRPDILRYAELAGDTKPSK